MTGSTVPYHPGHEVFFGIQHLELQRHLAERVRGAGQTGIIGANRHFEMIQQPFGWLLTIQIGGRHLADRFIHRLIVAGRRDDQVGLGHDIVLIDSAPVLAVSDTLFLGVESDAVLLVCLAGVTPRDVVVRARDTLLDANMNLIGVLVNNVSEVLPYYYDYKYYGAYKKVK